jgi:hypothetical protein
MLGVQIEMVACMAGGVGCSHASHIPRSPPWSPSDVAQWTPQKVETCEQQTRRQVQDLKAGGLGFGLQGYGPQTLMMCPALWGTWH